MSPKVHWEEPIEYQTIETEAIEDFLRFHVYGHILFKHGKTTAGFSTFTRLISQ
ncbi:MAG: hypothetical protein H6Q41_3109 [Deltaproteobacteria bacterium]|jgi:hypothetical protein|nr:hypothetical protein [Deltaproteobacteria bacterium]